MMDFSGTKYMQNIQKVETRFRYVGDLRQKMSEIHHQEQEHQHCKAEKRIAALLQEKEEEIIVIGNAQNSKVLYFLISILQ